MQAVAALRGQFGGHQVMSIAEGEKLRQGDVPTTAKRSAKKESPTKQAAEARVGEAGEQARGGLGVEGQRRRGEAGRSLGSGLGDAGDRHGRHGTRSEARREEDRQEGLSRAPHPPCTSVT